MLLRLACLLALLVACTPPSRGDRGDDTSDTSGGTTTEGGGTTSSQCPAAKACGSRTCGADPVCGLSCGTCQGGLVCQSGQCAPAADPSCTNGTACVGDSDCASGSRCNHALSPPQCQKLYCGKTGSPCEQSYFCAQGSSCLGSVCESPSSGGSSAGSVSGSVQGHRLQVRSAVFGDVGFQGGYYVALTDDADICRHLTEGRTVAGTSGVSLVAFGVTGQGTFQVRNDFSPGSVVAGFGGTDAQCQQLVQPSGAQASSGSVQLTAFVPSSSVSGTFQLQFGSDTLSGSFNAVYCAAHPSSQTMPCTSAP